MMIIFDAVTMTEIICRHRHHHLLHHHHHHHHHHPLCITASCLLRHQDLCERISAFIEMETHNTCLKLVILLRLLLLTATLLPPTACRQVSDATPEESRSAQELCREVLAGRHTSLLLALTKNYPQWILCGSAGRGAPATTTITTTTTTTTAAAAAAAAAATATDEGTDASGPCLRIHRAVSVDLD
jgi:hypothetical protein